MVARFFILKYALILIFVFAFVSPGCSRGKSRFLNTGSTGGASPPAETRTLVDILDEVRSFPRPDAADEAVFESLRSELVRQLESRGQSRIASAASPSAVRVENLSYFGWSDGPTLLWEARLTGDANCDGEVGVADITPIALRYLRLSNDGLEDGFDMAADTDGNGEVSVSDVTPIAVNYLSTLDGYAVYRGDTSSGPWAVAGGSEFDPSLVFPETKVIEVQGRPNSYLFEDAAYSGEVPVYYRVLPVSGGLEVTDGSDLIIRCDKASSLSKDGYITENIEFPSAPGGAPYLKNEILVAFEPGIPAEVAVLRILATGAGVEIVRRSQAGNFFQLRTTVHVDEMPADLSKLDLVSGAVGAQPNYLLAAPAMSGSAPSYLNPEPDAGLQWNLDGIHANDGWEYGAGGGLGVGGSGASIALIDTGIDADSHEFTGRIDAESVYIDGIPDDPGDPDLSGFIEDEHGNGTAVAAIAAAAQDRDGMSGVAFATDLLVVKTGFGGLGGEWYIPSASLAEAVYYAVARNADAIHISAAVNWNPGVVVENAIAYAVANNIPVICPVGDDGADVSQYFPAAYVETIAVGATDSENGGAELSNHGNLVDLSAPGHSVYTAQPDDYRELSGTALASAHVAGAVAMMRAVDEFGAPSAIRDMLRTYVTPLDPGLGLGTGIINLGLLMPNVPGAQLTPQVPVAIIETDMAGGYEPLTVNFDGSASYDPWGGLIVEYAWDFTDDGTWDAFGAAAQYEYAADGAYTAKLRVTSDIGVQAYDTVEITVDPIPPDILEGFTVEISFTEFPPDITAHLTPDGEVVDENGEPLGVLDFTANYAYTFELAGADVSVYDTELQQYLPPETFHPGEEHFDDAWLSDIAWNSSHPQFVFASGTGSPVVGDAGPDDPYTANLAINIGGAGGRTMNLTADIGMDFFAPFLVGTDPVAVLYSEGGTAVVSLYCNMNEGTGGTEGRTFELIAADDFWEPEWPNPPAEPVSFVEGADPDNLALGEFAVKDEPNLTYGTAQVLTFVVAADGGPAVFRMRAGNSLGRKSSINHPPADGDTPTVTLLLYFEGPAPPGEYMKLRIVPIVVDNQGNQGTHRIVIFPENPRVSKYPNYIEGNPAWVRNTLDSDGRICWYFDPYTDDPPEPHTRVYTSDVWETGSFVHNPATWVATTQLKEQVDNPGLIYCTDWSVRTWNRTILDTTQLPMGTYYIAVFDERSAEPIGGASFVKTTITAPSSSAPEVFAIADADIVFDDQRDGNQDSPWPVIEYPDSNGVMFNWAVKQDPTLFIAASNLGPDVEFDNVSFDYHDTCVQLFNEEGGLPGNPVQRILGGLTYAPPPNGGVSTLKPYIQDSEPPHFTGMLPGVGQPPVIYNENDMGWMVFPLVQVNPFIIDNGRWYVGVAKWAYWQTPQTWIPNPADPFAIPFSITNYSAS
ncbi:MAG: S8 family serine peptidase [bacterium]|jgi:serine protease